MHIGDYGLRINGLTAEDIHYNIYALRADVKRWSRKVATARTDHTRQQYTAKVTEAQHALTAHERRWRQLQIRTTLEHLRRCRAARAAGHRVSYTTDPAWLVEQAINRRADWPEDPSDFRGSCMPVGGRYPTKASGSAYNDLRNLSRKLNTPRMIVQLNECGQWRTLIRARLPHRLFEA